MKLLVAVAVFAMANGAFGQLVTQAQFNSATTRLGYPAPSGAQYNAFNSNLHKASITTKQEAAMALTHYLHESDGLRAKREYRCAQNGCPGEYQTPGCDRNGQRYYGRGYIQLTWCYNYRQASIELYGNDWMVDDADAVARDEYIAWDTAFWFWRVNVHSRSGVQEGRFGATTRAINGGLECDGAYQHIARQRFQNYGVVRSAFGLSGAGDERGCYN
ncbi:unnamed protein product [Allacma fusca]|uniref:Glycoside hydrolase family 19 catalytic domain-containing protein n=2 Tax=Allacma fusca TaxID=39272 RepID=A0A8J2K3N8_9HEXA|nr:unnamed protein product [Allacma fusca]